MCVCAPKYTQSGGDTEDTRGTQNTQNFDSHSEYIKEEYSMGNQQPIYLLAAGHGKGISATFSDVGRILKSLNKAKPSVAYIGVASMRDNWSVYSTVSRLIKRRSYCRINRVLIAPQKADLNVAREKLLGADAVFFSGGDVEAGMQVLKEKGMIDFFRKLAKTDKLFFGISAGSIMLGREWVRWRNPDDNSTAELFPCLGIAPIICDTHDEADDWAELKTLLRLERDGTLGYGITSGSCLKVYPDGGLDVENGSVARYILQNGKVERRSDVLPGDHAG